VFLQNSKLFNQKQFQNELHSVKNMFYNTGYCL